jgi:carboxyl-terminal processing protease
MILRRLPRRLIAASLAASFGLTAALAPLGLGVQLAVARTVGRETDANITRVTARILEDSQFSKKPLDAATAHEFISRYVDTLDPAHSVFLASDVASFAKSCGALGDATRAAGDTTLARAIFARYLGRLADQTTYLRDLLSTASFDFHGSDAYSFDREQAARPADAVAAHALWREQLRGEYLQAKLGGKDASQIVRTLTQRHARLLATMQALNDDEVLSLYLNALAHVYDPHSDYLGREEMQDFAIQMNLSLSGIGATLEDADGVCTVRELVPGGPAAESGLVKPGDRIVAVAQAGQEAVDITKLPLHRAVDLIRGKDGSTVTLSLLAAAAPEGSPTRTAALVRRQVKLEDHAAKARIVDLPSERGTPLRVGVVTLPSFYAGSDESGGRSATDDVARLLGKLKAERVRGIVLDLRDNPGGSLAEAIRLSGLFIRTGPIVQTRDRDGNIEAGVDHDPAVQYDGPLVVLTSKFSASAAEILAGALQDYGRALVVGDASTFGKGTVQTVLPLARVMDQVHLPHAYDPGALKVTISKFYRPSGASTQRRGVSSDIVLPSTRDVVGVSESALKDALPWDTVGRADYEPLDRVAPYQHILRQRSATRVAADPRFRDVKADMDRIAHVMATKTVSLNEDERRKELASAKTREKERETEDRAALAAEPPTYDLTLQDVARPGLPPRVIFGAPAASPLAPSNPDDPRGLTPDATRKGADVTLDETLRILADYVSLKRGN